MSLRNAIFAVQNQFFYVLGTAIFFAFFCLTVWGDNGLLKLVELKDLRQSVAAQNRSLLLENLGLTERIDALKHLPAVEQTARSTMGFVREDESVIVIPKGSP